MRRIYGLHPWELTDYRWDEIQMLLKDLNRLDNATTRG